MGCILPAALKTGAADVVSCLHGTAMPLAACQASLQSPQTQQPVVGGAELVGKDRCWDGAVQA